MYLTLLAALTLAVPRAGLAWSWLEDLFKKSKDGTQTYLELKKSDVGLKVNGPINATGGVTLQLPSVKGVPDTLSLRNTSDVPVILYAPAHITTDVYRPVITASESIIENYTVPATKMYGFAFNNYGATGAITLNLPSAVVGMNIAVQLAAAQDVDINPADADRIMGLTNAAGDAISSDATIGSFILLQCFYAGTWQVIASNGTWTDVN